MLNNGQKIILPLKPCDQGLTLHQYTARHAAWFQGHDVALYLADGRFTQDNHPLTGTDTLNPKSPLLLFRPPWREPEIPTDLHVVHQSPTLLVVDKPAGLPITPTGDFYQNTLLHLLRADFPQITPAHRLDVDTSGLILWVKQPQARGFYQKLFQQGRVGKIYDALAFGRLDPERRTIELPLGRDTTIYTKHIHRPTGKPAQTQILAVTHWRDLSHVRLSPITGRTNQLRAHLAAVGHPLVGDRKYFTDPKVFLEWLEHKDPNHGLDQIRLPRHCLHCAELTFPTQEGETLHLVSKRPVLTQWQDALS